jgi:hypothetical protein
MQNYRDFSRIPAVIMTALGITLVVYLQLRQILQGFAPWEKTA